MILKVTLTKKLTDDTWGAIGSFVTEDASKKGPAEVLVKQVDNKSVTLIVDSKIQPSKIMNREIVMYSNVKPVSVSSVKKGTEVTFNQISATLNKLSHGN